MESVCLSGIEAGALLADAPNWTDGSLACCLGVLRPKQNIIVWVIHCPKQNATGRAVTGLRPKQRSDLFGLFGSSCNPNKELSFQSVILIFQPEITQSRPLIPCFRIGFVELLDGHVSPLAA